MGTYKLAFNGMGYHRYRKVGYHFLGGKFTKLKQKTMISHPPWQPSLPHMTTLPPEKNRVDSPSAVAATAFVDVDCMVNCIVMTNSIARDNMTANNKAMEAQISTDDVPVFSAPSLSSANNREKTKKRRGGVVIVRDPLSGNATI